MSNTHEEQDACLQKRREQYRVRKRMLVDMGILPDRRPGRPRLRSLEEAHSIAKAQKLESDRRTRLHIKQELKRLEMLKHEGFDGRGRLAESML